MERNFYQNQHILIHSSSNDFSQFFCQKLNKDGQLQSSGTGNTKNVFFLSQPVCNYIKVFDLKNNNGVDKQISSLN